MKRLVMSGVMNPNGTDKRKIDLINLKIGKEVKKIEMSVTTDLNGNDRYGVSLINLIKRGGEWIMKKRKAGRPKKNEDEKVGFNHSGYWPNYKREIIGNNESGRQIIFFAL